MRVSLEWLNEYVDISGLAPQKIADALTQAGLEVEGIENNAPAFNNVVVGKVTQLEPHPNADKLRLVSIDLGTEQTRVVCGAPNVAEGMLIAFAKDGATVLNRKDGTSFVLGKATIRGVESAGMVCSLDELGLQDRYPKGEDGIWPLQGIANADQLGQDLKQVLNLGGDTVLEVAPTANRGDLMSMVGVAREVAALFDRPVKDLALASLPDGAPGQVSVKLSDLEVCSYYGGAMLKNIRIGPAPDWMARRLQAAGVRSISNVVDITNYVMLEMGQPLHAFDGDKLGQQGTIDVRRAREGETLITLDEVEHTLTPQAVVVTMNDQPVALAGVMGGFHTEIGNQSKNLFLESAYFAPQAIRKSAKSVGMRSEASARFERGVDPATCRLALIRAIELLQELAGAEFVGMTESATPSVESSTLPLRLARLEQVLGLSIDEDTCERILEKLGFRVQPGPDKGFLEVKVPTYRVGDVTREIDIIEEIIRIYGYDRVPYTLPNKTASAGVSFRQWMTGKAHAAMRAQGLQEVMTTSLIGESLLEKTGIAINREQLVQVNNSHSSDHTMLRQSLIPNLLEVAKFNQGQGVEYAWVYEMGRTYFKRGKASYKSAGVQEKLMISGLITGRGNHGVWHEDEQADFYRAKGVVESLLTMLNLGQQTVYQAEKDIEWLHPGKTAKVFLENGKRELGFIGELHPLVQQRLKFRHPVYVFELDVEVLQKMLKQRQTEGYTVVLSPFPAVERDMAMLVPNTLTHQEILQAVAAQQLPLLKNVELFDEYRSEQLGEGNRSLAYRLTFQSAEGTLTDAQVDAWMQQIRQSLQQTHSVQFR